MSTRTIKIAAIQPVGAVQTTVLTVPVGFTFIVKDIIVNNQGGATDTITVFAEDPAVVFSEPINHEALAPLHTREWSGFWVLAPGDTLNVLAALGTSTFWISGAKLIGSA